MESVQSSKFLCGICFDYKPVCDRFEDGMCVCNQSFCTHCISKHVESQINQNILNVTCPTPNCPLKLNPESLHTILPGEVILKWESARCESLIVVSEKTYCPFKDCSVLLVDDGGEVVTSAECPSCHRLFCAQCKVPWHGSQSCEEFRRDYKDEQELDNKFFNLVKVESWQRCPQCTMFVEKHSGCNHVTCRCGYEFCYKCGEHWNGHLCN